MTADRPFYIYCHTAPNGKRYIGQTCLELEQRWAGGRGYDNCTLMHRAIEKYGWSAFRHDILAVCHYKSVADKLERYYIEKYDTFNPEHGYNLTKGGDGVLGCTWSEERKKARSERLRGEGNPMYGRHHSEEMRRKMSEERTGKRLSPEHREKVTKALLEQVALQKKPIRQLDLDGNLIATYPGISDVEEATGFNHGSIVSVCRGKADQAYGYLWEYEDEELRTQSEKTRAQRHESKRERIRHGFNSGGMGVIQLDMNGVEIARYASLSEAEKKTGFFRDRIGDCCHGGLDSYEGYMWRFENGGQQGAEKVAVRQLDLEGNEIATYESLALASSKTGTPRYKIRNCCRGRCKTTQGYKWEFVDEKHRLNVPKARVGVVQFDADGNEVGRYKSLTSAMRATGHNRHRIAECCKGELESYRGYTWRFTDAA